MMAAHSAGGTAHAADANGAYHKLCGTTIATTTAMTAINATLVSGYAK